MRTPPRENRVQLEEIKVFVSLVNLPLAEAPLTPLTAIVHFFVPHEKIKSGRGIPWLNCGIGWYIITTSPIAWTESQFWHGLFYLAAIGNICMPRPSPMEITIWFPCDDLAKTSKEMLTRAWCGRFSHTRKYRVLFSTCLVLHIAWLSFWIMVDQATSRKTSFYYLWILIGKGEFLWVN